MAGAAGGGVVKDAHANVLEDLDDLVGGVDMLFGGVTLLSGVRFARSTKTWQIAVEEPAP